MAVVVQMPDVGIGLHPASLLQEIGARALGVGHCGEVSQWQGGEETAQVELADGGVSIVAHHAALV